MGKESSSSSSSSSSVRVLQWLNQMVSEPHYLFHFFTFFSYFVIRSSATQVLEPNLTNHLLRRVTLSRSLVFVSLQIAYLFTLFRMYVNCDFSGNTNSASFRRVGSHQGTCCWNQIEFNCLLLSNSLHTQ